MEIRFENVSYFNLKDISFKIKENKITFILGESGSGKSTLLSLINFDYDDYMGNIFNDVSNKIGFLRQNFMDYICFNTVYEEFLFILKKKRVKTDYDKKILNSLKMVGLDRSILNKNPFKISKGEQKKMALAFLLAQKYKVFLLDEPFMDLDFESKKRFIKLFRMMKLKYGKTIIIASSDTDIALSLADDVIGLSNGNLIFQGDKFDLFMNTKLLNENNIDEPDIIRFENLVKNDKGIDIGYRDDINDLMKDIYRFVK